MNINYIRAAIEAKTGYRLSLAEVRSLLIEEGLTTKDKSRNAIFPGYEMLFGDKAERMQSYAKYVKDYVPSVVEVMETNNAR